jgi:hypothetical protein
MKKRKKEYDISEKIIISAVVIPIVGVIFGTTLFFGSFFAIAAGSNIEPLLTGIGFYSVIIGVILFIISIIIHDKEIDKKDKSLKKSNSKLTVDLLKRVEKFKIENGFSESEVIENNDKYYWTYNDHFLSIGTDKSYKDDMEKASGYYIEDLENGLKVSQLDLFERNIPFGEIEYFQIQGEITKTEKITGGGSSLAGAVVGAAVAGGVGAIIGSRKKIKSKTVTSDDRSILFVYKKNNKLVKEKLNYYPYLDILETLIPEKEYSYVLSKK